MWQSDTMQWRRWSPLVSLSFCPARLPTHHGCWFCFLFILNLPLIVFNFISPTRSLNNPPTDVDSGGASATQAGLQRAPLRLCWETYPAALSGAWGDSWSCFMILYLGLKDVDFLFEKKTFPAALSGARGDHIDHDFGLLFIWSLKYAQKN